MQNGTLTSTVAAFDGQSGTVIASLAGPVALNMSGGGTLVVSNSNNSYSGGTNISGGILQLGAANALPAGGNITIYSNGTFDLGGVSQSTSGVVSFQGGTVQDGTLTSTAAAFDGQSGDVTANLAGGVALNKTTASMLTLGGSATYTGNTVVLAGTLQFGSSTGVPHGPTAGNLVLDGGALSAGTVNVNGFAADVGGLSGAAGAVPGVILNSAFGANATLTVGDNNANTTFSGTLADGNSTLGLNKSGSGTLTLAGINTYSGSTTVSQGILAPTSTAAFGTITASSTMSVKSGGELQLPAGVVTSLGNVLVAGSGVTGPGEINGGTLNVLGTNLTATNSSGTAVIGSPIVLNAGTTTLTATNSNAYLWFTGPFITSGNVTASGSGNFVFSGGAVNIAGELQASTANQGIVVLPGTTLTAGDYHNGSFGNLTVNGTMNTGSIQSGNSGNGNELLNGSGVINTSLVTGLTNGGTVEFSKGVLNVSGSFVVGRTSFGVARGFQQDSGTVSVTSTGDGFTIGNLVDSGTGAYTMNGGSLSVPSEYVELCYTGTTATPAVVETVFQVSSSAGGLPTANVYGISFGQTVNSGTQNGSGLLKLGNAGSRLVIGAGGIIAASSGSLQVQLGSGTLASSAPWLTTMPMTLNGPAATNIDASGGTISLGGAISGGTASGLQEIGSGVLVLSGTNSYAGGTTVAGGTMIVTNNEAIDGNNLGNNSLMVGNDLSAFGGVIAAAAPPPAGIATALPAIAAAVPEPGTLVLLALAAGCGIGIWRRSTRETARDRP